MSLILLISIAIRLAAAIGSLISMRRLRDWRMGFFTLMLALMALRQILTLLATIRQPGLHITLLLGPSSELPGLLVSGLALLAVIYLARILAANQKREEQLNEYKQHLEELVAARTEELVQANNRLEQAIEKQQQDITERRQTEEKLRESENRYSSLFKNNHAIMLLIDPATAVIIDANPAACTYYGYSYQELTNLKITDINQLSAEEVYQEMERARAEHRRQFYFRHRLSSGELRDVEVYSGPIQLAGKQLLYSIIHDITARNQMEQALRDSKAQTETLYKISRRLNAAQNETDLLQVLAHPALQAGADNATLMYIDLDETGQEPEWVEIVATWQREPGQTPANPVGTRLHAPSFPCSRLWLSSPTEPVLISNVATDEHLDDKTRQLFTHSGYQAVVLIPLSHVGQWVGVLNFNWHQPHPFQEQEVNLYHALVGLAAPAVHSRRLLIEKERAIVESLYDISRGLNTAPTAQALLEVMAQPAIEANVFNANLFAIELDQAGQPEWAECIASWQREGQTPWPGVRFQLVHYPVINTWMAQPDKVHLIADMLTDEQIDENTRQIYQERGGRSAAIIPLSQTGRWVGLLVLTWHEIHPFSPQEEEIYKTLPSLAAPAVENHRLLNHLEQRVADRTAALQESEERFRAVIQQSADGISLYNQQGMVLEWNRGLEHITGYKRADIVGRFIWEAHHKMGIVSEKNLSDNPDSLKNETLYMLQNHLPEDGLLHVHDIRRLDGERRTLQVRLFPIRLNNERLIGSIIRDVTDSMQAEKELLQAKEAAEIANRAKSEFLANMSHELRTPLNAILGYTQIMQNDKILPPGHQDNLATIHSSGQHLLTLINDILDLSKIEAGRMELYLAEFGLPPFLKNIVNMFQIRADQKNILFNYHQLTPLPAIVQGDEKQLRQILINLLGNAIKFTRSGSVTFSVAAIDNNDPTPPSSPHYKPRHIRFQIEDTGPGIPTDRLEEIFQPFSQGDTAHFTEGTGLGLAISRRLAHLMGGTLHVESRPGEGSVFWIELTLLERTTGPLADPIQPAAITGYRGQPYRVLVADDRPENRTFLFEALAALGFEMIEAIDGQDGLEKAAQFKPHLILADLLMPRLNGLDMVRQIRRSVPPKRPVIIAVSASVYENHRQQSLDAGCDDFIPKPICLDKLLQVIGTHLPIEWTYAEELPAKTEQPSQDPPPPPAETLAALYQMARIGDIEGILEQTDRIAQMADQFHPFGAKIRRLARSYQIREILDLLEKYKV